MLLTSLSIDPDELAARTGWVVKPEGACRDEVCVPLPESARNPDGTIDATVLSERLGMPLVGDDSKGLWALGPAAGPTARALVSAVAPELNLPDLRTGETFSLSSLKGQKVALIAWASW
jgi:hypothetical protein